MIPLVIIATSVALQTDFESWSDDDRSIDEITHRVAVGVELSPRWRFDVRGGYVSISGDGLEDLSTVTDTRARLSFRPSPNAVLRLGVNAPTGQSSFEEAELPTAAVVANRLFGLTTTRVGEGLGVDVGGAVSFPVGSAAVGVGVGYLLRGGFEPFDDRDEEYVPGNQVSLAGGVDFSGPAWLFRTNARLALFGEEELDGDPTFQHGDRFDVQTLLLRRLDRMSLWGSVRYVALGAGEVLTGSGDDVDEVDVNAGDELALSAGVYRSWPSGHRFNVAGELRSFAGSDVDDTGTAQGEGSRLSARARFEMKVGDDTFLDLGIEIASLSVDSPFPALGVESDATFTGLHPSVGLRTTF